MCVMSDGILLIIDKMKHYGVAIEWALAVKAVFNSQVLEEQIQCASLLFGLIDFVTLVEVLFEKLGRRKLD